MNGDVIVERRGPIGIIRFNRPQKKNALTAAMYVAVSDALETIEADDTARVHVLLGSPGIFTAGNDIGDFLATSQGQGGLGTDVLRCIRLFPQLTKPLIAGVDGKAIGVGTTLLFHCDLVYATLPSAFATPFLDLGLVPEAASSLLMPMRMGYARAFEMLVLGNSFSAEQGKAAGFINDIVAAEALENTVLAAAERLAAKPPAALAAARRLMRPDVAEIVQQTDREAREFQARLASPEAREAFQAFLEKRPPNFMAG
jgi:enoyl-CoA hydratase/carnithine racemase